MELIFEERDIQILEILKDGFTIKEVASKIFLSPSGTRDRIKTLRRKHGCRNTTHLVVTYLTFVQNRTG